MRKIKLALIPNASSRRATYMNRSKGLKKKLNELITLCDVKACAIINNPYQSAPDLWPSPEGVQEVVSMFRELPEAEQTKYMMNQETLLQDMIAKKEKKLKKIAQENRELLLKGFMFDCLQGKMSQYRYDARDFHDLIRYIDHYVDQLRYHKTQLLITTGESSSFSHVPVAGNDALVTANPQHYVDAAAVTAPVGSFDHIQYQNMNQNQQETVQHNVSADFDHLIQYQNMDMNQNQQELVQHNVYADFDHLNQYQNMAMNQNIQELVQHNVSADYDYVNQYQDVDMNQNQMEEVPYQTPDHFYDQTQHGMYQDMDLGTNQDVNVNKNHYPGQGESFIDQMVEDPQQISYVGENGNTSYMVDNHYNNYQVPPKDDQYQHGIYQNMDLGSGQGESFVDQMVEDPQQMSYVGEHASTSYMVDDHYNNYQLPPPDFSTTGYMPFSSNNNNGSYVP